MTETVLAAEEGGAAIHVGHHTMVFELFGMTFNGDTIMATAITALIIIGLAFYLKSKVTSTGVPGKVQLFWEALTIQMRGQIESSVGMKVAPFVLPLAVALFAFILISNWLAVFPWQYGGSTALPLSSTSRPPRTSTSCWRWRCSCSSSTTQQVSSAAASSATRSRW